MSIYLPVAFSSLRASVSSSSSSARAAQHGISRQRAREARMENRPRKGFGRCKRFDKPKSLAERHRRTIFAPFRPHPQLCGLLGPAIFAASTIAIHKPQVDKILSSFKPMPCHLKQGKQVKLLLRAPLHPLETALNQIHTDADAPFAQLGLARLAPVAVSWPPSCSQHRLVGPRSASRP